MSNLGRGEVAGEGLEGFVLFFLKSECIEKDRGKPSRLSRPLPNTIRNRRRQDAKN